MSNAAPLHLYDTNNYIRKRYEADQSGLALRNLFNEAFHVTDPMIFVFDGKNAKETRRKIYPDYKIHRPPTPDAFYVILSAFEELAAHTCKCTLKIDEHEADDVIATLVRQSPGVKILIHSNDGDYLRLCNEYVSMTEPPALSEKVALQDIRLYKTLVGDPSDNIKGVLKFGPVAFDALGENRKALWCGWLDANPWKLAQEGMVKIPDAADLGLSNSQYLWFCENHRVIRGYWNIVNFVDVDNDLMMKHLKVGKPNYELGNSLLKDMLQ